MTGIGMAAASGKSVAVPLTGSISLTGGDTYNVSGASGDLYTSFGSEVVFSCSGGTPPLSGNNTYSVIKDAGNGSVSTTTVSGHNALTWSGMSVGDTVLCHLNYHVTDSGSPQQILDINYPSGGSFVAIHRAS